jgi:hypothetical protein
MKSTRYKAEITYHNDELEIIEGVIKYETFSAGLRLSGTDFEIFLALNSSVNMVYITEDLDE